MQENIAVLISAILPYPDYLFIRKSQVIIIWHPNIDPHLFLDLSFEFNALAINIDLSCNFFRITCNFLPRRTE